MKTDMNKASRPAVCAPHVRRRAEQGHKAEQTVPGSFESELMTARVCVYVMLGGGGGGTARK